MRRWLIRMFFYPNKEGRPVRRDPTYGRIARDIQWIVQDEYQPKTLGQRVALEESIQNQRR
jgi:hypothetical protein